MEEKSGNKIIICCKKAPKKLKNTFAVVIKKFILVFRKNSSVGSRIL